MNKLPTKLFSFVGDCETTLKTFKKGSRYFGYYVLHHVTGLPSHVEFYEFNSDFSRWVDRSSVEIDEVSPVRDVTESELRLLTSCLKLVML